MTTDNDRKTSRRSVLRAGATAVTGVAVTGLALTAGGMAGQAQAQTKIAQKLVQYIPVSKKPTQNCANCSQFVAPNACKIVEGEVAPAGWCLSWAPVPKTAS